MRNDRRAIAIATFAAALATTCDRTSDCDDCRAVRAGLTLDTATIFGFEKLTAWQVDGATATLSSVASQGTSSFSLAGITYATLT